MATRKRGNTLERWEVALVKAMLARKRYNDQDILAYFTRPTRTINHRLISQIRSEDRHKAIRAASEAALEDFLSCWPDVDGETGLSIRGDELLVKAREAMIAAVHNFNSAGLSFRAEIFITTAVIAWTYLCHALLKREGIDYRYYEGGELKLTPGGSEKYWELGKCLKHDTVKLTKSVKANLELLLEIRHEIEHRSTSRIDHSLGPLMQACCINFNEAIRTWFGKQFGLERRLPIALQFSPIGSAQLEATRKGVPLHEKLEQVIETFHAGLEDSVLADQAFSFRVALVPKLGKASKSDVAIEFVDPGSPQAAEINVLLKDVSKSRYTATQIVEKMKAEGFACFNQAKHTNLWQQLDARNPAKGYGQSGDYKNTWVWFDPWVERVRAHCQENAALYAA